MCAEAGGVTVLWCLPQGQHTRGVQKTRGLTVLFLVWAAELDQYVFQDSQLDGLGKDIFSKLGASWLSVRFLPCSLGSIVIPDDHPSKGGRILPQHRDNEGSLWASTDYMLVSFFFPQS